MTVVPYFPKESDLSWATSWEFEAHRDVITRLYINEAKSLHQVVDIMTRDYGFRATSV